MKNDIARAILVVVSLALPILITGMWEQIDLRVGYAFLAVCVAAAIVAVGLEWRTRKGAADGGPRSDPSTEARAPDVHPPGADAYREPVRRWTFGFGQGHQEGSIRNNGGAVFRISYGAGTDSPTSSVSLDIPQRGPLRASNDVDAVLEIDGVAYEWAFQDDGGTAFFSEVLGWRNANHLAEIVAAMEVGQELAVTLPLLRVQERFSLAGAKEVLASVYGDVGEG